MPVISMCMRNQIQTLSPSEEVWQCMYRDNRVCVYVCVCMCVCRYVCVCVKVCVGMCVGVCV